MGEKCEICGAEANNMTVSFFVRTNWNTGMQERKPQKRHYYCDEHNQDGEEIDVTCSPMFGTPAW